MEPKFNPQDIDKMVGEEIDYFLKDEPDLKTDVEYVYKIGIPDRPKAFLMMEFARVLGVNNTRIKPFIMVADLIMAAAMNSDDIIDDNNERCEQPSLWKIKGVNSTITVTDYMYGLIFSILKKYRPSLDSSDFIAYQKSENLLLDYFLVMNIAQYRTTVTGKLLPTFTINDLEKLATQKASLLFQFCSTVPAYFANKFISESESFGYQLGIARQYISDVQDFMEIPGDSYKQGSRMEDYFTHQPNLVLILTGISGKLSPEEKTWFYDHWIKSIPEKDRGGVTTEVVRLITKTDAINESRKELHKIKNKLQLSLQNLPDEEFKQNMSKWAFRSFPMD